MQKSAFLQENPRLYIFVYNLESYGVLKWCNLYIPGEPNSKDLVNELKIKKGSQKRKILCLLRLSDKRVLVNMF